jgi:hypothetical protein
VIPSYCHLNSIIPGLFETLRPQQANHRIHLLFEIARRHPNRISIQIMSDTDKEQAALASTDIFLNIAYQGGEIGLASLAFFLILLNPFWFNQKPIYAALSATFLSLLISAIAGTARMNFHGSDELCRVLVGIDLFAYATHIHIVVILIVWRLIIVMARKWVILMAMIYFAAAASVQVTVIATAKARIEFNTLRQCRTGKLTIPPSIST